MTSEQIARLRAFGREGQFPVWGVSDGVTQTWKTTPEVSEWITMALRLLPRLLDEREALLNALRAWVGPDDDDPEDRNWHHVEDGQHFFMDGHDGGKSPEECPVCLSRAAIAKAAGP